MSTGRATLIDFLASSFPDYPEEPFENEYEIQLWIHKQTSVKDNIVTWLEEFKPNPSQKSLVDSNAHREAGNRLFRSNKKLNALEASRCYTQAILKAPEGSEALSLAYGNRSAAITEFGYYKEAYEDCQCAIEFGYPKHKLQKIIIRQAFCAVKLQDFQKLKDCLKKLKKMPLSPQFTKQRAEFEKELPKLKGKNTLAEKAKPKKEIMIHDIITHPERGRNLSASKDINKGEEILRERAFVFTPVGKAKICSNCATQNFVPFPCNTCSKVFYCSLKCKQVHLVVHRFECYGYKCGFFNTIGVTHLALNALLRGLPSIVSNLIECKTAEDVWQIIENLGKTERGERGYTDVLRLVSNLSLMDRTEVCMYSMTAAIVIYYLSEFTNFLTFYEEANACSPFDWTVIVSALLLRHTTQMICNAHTSINIIPLDDTLEFYMLSSMWTKPNHLRKYQLHNFGRTGNHYAAIFSYLSICNHSCEPSLRSKFDGNHVTSIARHRIKRGAEIFNSYTLDYRASPKAERQEELKAVYNFDCKCERCTANDEDLDYINFHKYRCQSPGCQAIFSPSPDDIRWWFEGKEMRPSLTCFVCKADMSLDWYWRFAEICNDTGQLSKVMELWNFSERVLVDLNEVRYRIAFSTVCLFFDAWKSGCTLTRSQFEQIGNCVNYMLNVIEAQHDVESLVYASKTTFALDIMANGKYLDFDTQKINESLKMLPAELRNVFDNYIEDYLEDVFYDSKIR